MEWKNCPTLGNWRRAIRIDAIEMCDSCSSTSKQFNGAKLISQKRKLCALQYLRLYNTIYVYAVCWSPLWPQRSHTVVTARKLRH